jgi:Ala-tRNA(Pro) deacylase
MKVLGVTPGTVSPFTLINDRDQRVKIVLDSTLMAADIVNFHPLTNDATTSISPAGLLTFIASCGHDPLIIDVQAIGSV